MSVLSTSHLDKQLRQILAISSRLYNKETTSLEDFERCTFDLAIIVRQAVDTCKDLGWSEEANELVKNHVEIERV
jgi:hypothetical protein